MKVIITGATGFIGRNLVQCLSSRDIEVLATGRNAAIGKKLEELGARFKACDVSIKKDVLENLEAADCVIHCAGKAGDWGSSKEFYQVNVVGTRNVIEACKKNNINKLIFLSTPSIYYTGKDRYDITEDDPLPRRFITDYARTKYQAEKELLALGETGFQTIILRPRAVYGPHDATIAPRILKLAARKRYPLLDGGKALIDITYVGNLVEAVCQSVNALDNAWNQVYNISNGSPVTLTECVEFMLDIYGLPFRPKTIPLWFVMALATVNGAFSKLPFGKKKPSFTRFSAAYMGRSMTLSIDKAKEMLGYMPVVGNKESFELFKNWYNQNQ